MKILIQKKQTLLALALTFIFILITIAVIVYLASAIDVSTSQEKIELVKLRFDFLERFTSNSLMPLITALIGYRLGTK